MVLVVNNFTHRWENRYIFRGILRRKVQTTEFLASGNFRLLKGFKFQKFFKVQKTFGFLPKKIFEKS